MNRCSKWKMLWASDLVSCLSNRAFRTFCDSGFRVWKHKVMENLYRVTISNDVDDVILDIATWEEVIEFLEEE